MRILFFIVVFLLSGLVTAQLELEKDTLKFEDRTGGSLDSMDISLALPATTMDGNFFVLNRSYLNISKLSGDVTETRYFIGKYRKNMKFSSLPRIGFHYSFGSRGTQFFNANYTQAFNDHFLINMEYSRSSSNGYLRNSDFSKHDLFVAFAGNWEHYNFQLTGNYFINNTTYSGGLISDTLLDVFDPQFLPVWKSAANGKSTTGNIEFLHRINLGDSSFRYGLKLDHIFNISNRKFYESDTIYGLYPSYVDSFYTYDQFNFPSISNAAGIFISNDRLYADLDYGVKYWEFQNSGLYTDTIENNMSSEFLLKLNRIKLSNHLVYNISGNYNGIQDDLNVAWKINKKSNFGFSAEYSSQAPIQVQRYYRSNNYNYHLQTIDRQDKLILSGKYTNSSLVDSLLRGGIEVNYISIKNPYVWNDSVWSNTVYNKLSFTNVHLDLSLKWKALNIQNLFDYNVVADQFIPEFIYEGRLFIQQPVFKAKKMKLQYGVGFNYYSSFRQRNFLPVINVFSWDSTSVLLPGISNLNVYGGFQIDEFRFYFRVEQLGVLWNDLKRMDVQNYPLARTRIRIGIVWDFFN